MTPISVRQRLQDHEFTDEQEITLTLELLNRIEQDIHDLKSTNPRHGFNLNVSEKEAQIAKDADEQLKTLRGGAASMPSAPPSDSERH